jgi:hypothetical protein
VMSEWAIKQYEPTFQKFLVRYKSAGAIHREEMRVSSNLNGRVGSERQDRLLKTYCHSRDKTFP